jgi:hypothetical protein
LQTHGLPGREHALQKANVLFFAMLVLKIKDIVALRQELDTVFDKSFSKRSSWTLFCSKLYRENCDSFL